MRAFLSRFRWWHEVTLFLLIVALLVFAEWSKPGFTQLNSQMVLSKHMWEYAILALAMTPIIISAGIDLSVGSSVGMCAVAFGICHALTGSVWASCGAAIVVGAAGGMLNGLLVAHLRVHPLIVTLATYAAFRGIAEGVSQGRPYSQFGDAFYQLTRWKLIGIPMPAYVFIVLAILMAIMLSRTPLGRQIYAMGHNERAARFSGVPVARIHFWLFTLAGVFAGLATILYMSRFDAAKADDGKGFELAAITAVVVGGTSVFGGRGNIVGTVLGLILIHEAQLFVGRKWNADELKSIMVGVLLIVSVIVSRLLSRRSRD